jgi:hypothetical protein
MQSELPKPHHNESYRAFEFSEFIQENWVYLGIVLIMIYIVVMYAKIIKDRKKNKDN